MAKITVYPHENGKDWVWWWLGEAPSNKYSKKKDAVKAAKKAAKKSIRMQKENYTRHIEPVMIEKHFRGSSNPKSEMIGESDL